MTLTSLETIIAALNGADVRYLLVGGLAVAAHGYGRVTIDVDVVLELTPSNTQNALTALGSLGYKPIVPVPVLDFCDPDKRKQWIEHKGMVVFSLRSETHPLTPVDLFVSEPFDFELEYKRAMVGEIGPNNPARFVCLSTLIRMKEEADRQKDRDDVRQLKLLLENLDDHG